jgi:hypothetical protein
MQKRNVSNKSRLVSKAQVKQMIKSNNNRQQNKKYALTVLGNPPSGGVVDSGATVQPLMAIGQGQTNQTRIGNMARITRIWGNINMYANSTDVMNSIRVIYFLWTDDSAAGVSDVLTNAANYTTSYYNLQNIQNGKLKILYDKNFMLNYGGVNQNCKTDMKVNIPVTWASTSAFNPVVNGLNVLVVSDSTVAPHPYVISSYAVEFDNE